VTDSCFAPARDADGWRQSYSRAAGTAHQLAGQNRALEARVAALEARHARWVAALEQLRADYRAAQAAAGVAGEQR
jgi:hypothetical protein